MATVEQRISRLEGAYEHLATKADLSQLENRLIKSAGRRSIAADRRQEDSNA